MSPKSLLLSWTLVAATGASAATAQSAGPLDAGTGSENVASEIQALQGRTSSATSSACGSCSTVGASSHPTQLATLTGAVVVFAVLARRKRT